MPGRPCHVELVTHTWLPQVKQLGIPSSAAFDFALFLADQSDVRDWNIQGLPADDFSTENGVVVTRGQGFTLVHFSAQCEDILRDTMAA